MYLSLFLSHIYFSSTSVYLSHILLCSVSMCLAITMHLSYLPTYVYTCIYLVYLSPHLPSASVPVFSLSCSPDRSGAFPRDVFKESAPMTVRLRRPVTRRLPSADRAELLLCVSARRQKETEVPAQTHSASLCCSGLQLMGGWARLLDSAHSPRCWSHPETPSQNHPENAPPALWAPCGPARFTPHGQPVGFLAEPSQTQNLSEKQDSLCHC